MQLFQKNRQNDQARLVEAPGGPPKRDLHEFIPYYSHLNPHTLVTKNGEVMQTIRITLNNQGLNYESGENDSHTLRAHIRKAIAESITSEHYAFWLHTVRKRKPVHYQDRFGSGFAGYVQEQWRKKNNWKFQYYNEIYLSVLHDGQSSDLFDKNAIQKVFLPNLNRVYRNLFLDNATRDLNATVDAILGRIHTHYRAERLSIVERSNHGANSAFYSEPAEFLGLVLNLQHEPMPVQECDLSQQICSHDLVFGFNAIESKAPGSQKRFGALISLKQYREITPEAADRLLQSPSEFIVSQAFSFTPARKALRDYKAQKDLFDASGDTYSQTASGLSEMLEGNRSQPTDFGEVQTTVMVLTDEYKQLDGEVRKVQEAFGDMGLLTVREDIKLEECFWAQLPGNFEFIRRHDIIRTDRSAGFCRLNLFPGGYDRGMHWGEALTLVPTMVNSPYFFNFHHQDNGHSILFDFNSFRDAAGSTLVNFLLASATKYNGRIYIFDRHRSAQLMMDKMGGVYHGFGGGRRTPSHALAVNPFSLEDSPRNRSFLLAWCNTLMTPHTPIDEAKRTLLTQAIEQVYAIPESERCLQALIDALAVEDYAFAGAFLRFVGEGEYAGLFDSMADRFNPLETLQAFSMDSLLQKSTCAVSMFAYLMHRIIGALDGKPTIIVLHEAWDLLENDFFAPRLESLMEMLTQNNAMLLVTTQNPEGSHDQQTFRVLMQRCATQIYVPDDINADYHQMMPELSEREVDLMSRMTRQKGDFLIRQGGESIGLSVDLYHMDDIKAIFAGDVKTLIAAGGKYASLPDYYAKEIK